MDWLFVSGGSIPAPGNGSATLLCADFTSAYRLADRKHFTSRRTSPKFPNFTVKNKWDLPRMPNLFEIPKNSCRAGVIFVGVGLASRIVVGRLVAQVVWMEAGSPL